MIFDDAVAGVLKNEGGYINNPNDPGGETNFGISKRSYPNIDIKNLTVDQAKQIYYTDYWLKVGCGRPEVPDDIRFDLFDAAVNCGVSRAVKLLQRAVDLPIIDGVLGPQTIAYLSRMPAWRICTRFNGARLLFEADLPNWQFEGRGWARRIANNLMRL